MRFISSTQIFSGTEYLSNNTVLVLADDNSISDIIKVSDVDASKIEYFEGIICPGFINTHCHLELSHLKNTIPQHTGIVNFGLDIIKNRNNSAEGLQLEMMQQADADMFDAGIVAVGDISNSKLSIGTKQKSKLYYHTFLELMALNPKRANDVFDSGRQLLTQFILKDLTCSLAPHAPYSASAELIQLIAQMNAVVEMPTSMHNQESLAEDNFFKTKTGDYLKLYQNLNLNIDFFEKTNNSSLQNVMPYFNTTQNTLLVHNTFTSANDIDFATNLNNKLFWCLCPNANLYIENALPNIELLLSKNCTLTLGTDSLASNHSLSILDEINCIRKHKPSVSFETLLKAATYNGAVFLGIDNKYGLIEKNRKSGLNVLQEKNDNYCLKKIG